MDEVAPGNLADEREALFRDLAGMLSELVFITDTAGVITFASAAALPVLGYQPGQLVGRPFLDFLFGSSIEQAGAAMQSLVRDRKAVEEFEVRVRAGDGRIVDTAVNAAPLQRNGEVVGCFGFLRNVTQARSADRALRESEELYRILFASINDAVFVNEVGPHGEPGRFLQVNDVACRRLGYSREELLAMTPRDISTKQAFEEAAPHRAELSEHGSIIMETVHVARDGRRIPVESSIRRTRYLGRPAAISISRDITERKRQEAERLEMERRLQQLQKLESLGVLAGGIAHDFNNILVSVLGHADLMMDELPKSSPLGESVREIERAARRAAELCRQMLAYSGRGKVQVEPIQLGRLVRDTMSLLHASVSKNATVVVEADDGLPTIDGDVSQLRQVLVNLVTNASEAIGSERGTVAIRTGIVNRTEEDLARAAVSSDLRSGQYICLEVSDTGCGMNRETLSRLFDPFFTTKFTGRGLGMAAVLGIVRGHQGAIEITSQPGSGTTFRVLFPVPGEASIPAAWTGSGCVLLVDDEKPLRDLGSRMLGRLGFSVIEAAGGREALAIYAAEAARVSLVLLDLSMPGMSGEETFQALRRINECVPILIASSYAEREGGARLAAANRCQYVQKPYSLAALRETLRQALPPNPAS